ncbi:thioredoxin family protein [Thiomicrorhabdus aquaedulcis]|uniref:thioredoxin family protein n=1 Tax=Thiomicrorhabdus aquaedulcis TaxID=2211106 RepID=UPI000FD9D265|nr:thioredoxin family protein [Thiomicrorhabdus aquaedulcis]
MKGNLMVRMMTLMVIVAVVLAHISGHTNLFTINWLWLALFASAMGLQATYTGFCPSNLIGKLSKTGQCCPSGSCSSTDSDSQTTPKNPTTSSACFGAGQSEPACCGNAPCSTLIIKVLGTGCANCTNTAKLIQSIADELNVAISIEKIEDIAQIASYGVMSTPAVVINDQVVHSGGVPSKSIITGWLLP